MDTAREFNCPGGSMRPFRVGNPAIRRCAVCHEERPLSEFPKDASSWQGRRRLCRVCFRAKQRDSWNWRKKEPDIHDRVTRARARYDQKRNISDHRRRQAKAHSAVRTALKNGTIVRGFCEICGSPLTEAHHDNYDYPLQVKWLCKIHHIASHQENNAKKT